jgi:uncharacterized protein YyaL (SSP411 family)
MITGELWDHEAGGFFRYTTRRDWRTPHYEKMLSDNAGLILVYLRAYQVLHEPQYIETAKRAMQFLDRVFWRDGYFAGSQDADEDYYTHSLAERETLAAPYLDDTLYVDANAYVARALVLGGEICGDTGFTDRGIECIKTLMRFVDPKQGMPHFARPGGPPTLYGRLDDAASMGLALTTGYQVTGDEQYLTAAESLADYVTSVLRLETGALADALTPGEVDFVKSRTVDAPANGRAAHWLLAMSALGRYPQGEKAAEEALRAVGALAREYTLFAADYAVAADGARHPWTVLRVAGPGEEVRGVLPKIFGVYRPFTVVEPQFSASTPLRIFPCQGQQCFTPIQPGENANWEMSLPQSLQ